MSQSCKPLPDVDPALELGEEVASEDVEIPAEVEVGTEGEEEDVEMVLSCVPVLEPGQYVA